MPLPHAPLVRAVESWFEKHQRPLPWRTSYDPFHVWVSEVMAQQTRIEVVVRYFGRFVERFPTLGALATASPDEVAAAWSGLGYYRRARMLRDGAIDVMNRFGGVIPQSTDDLQSIAGIGRYTAGAIASIAFRRRAAIVDGNIARIAARLFGIAQPVGSPALMRAAWVHAQILVDRCGDPRTFNQGLMEIGALICKPANPDCAVCPLTRTCVAFREKRTADLPVRKAKVETRSMRIALYLITDAEDRILMHRESGKLMGDLFHLPHGDTSLLSGRPLSVARSSTLGTFTHTVTTRRIEFELFAAELRTAIADEDEYIWVDRAELRNVPHPSYVSKALRLAARASR